MKKIALLLFMSVAILVVFLQQWVGFDVILRVMLSINPLFIPFILVLPFVTLMVYSYRWRFLLRSVDIEVKIPVVFRYALIGIVFNYITPMLRFGGEPVKGYLLANQVRTHKRKVFASLAMDSAITFISLLGLVYFAALGLSFFNVLDWFTLWTILTVILMPLTLGSYIVYNKKLLEYLSRKIEGILKRIRPGLGRGLPHDMMKFRDNMKKSFRRKDLLAKSMIIAISERFLEIFTFYIICVSLGVHIGIVECAIVLGVGILAGGIPLLPGGLVVYESSTIFIMTVLGINFAPATSAILVWRFASFWLVIIVGIVYSWFYGISFSMKKKQHFFKFGA